MPVREMDRKKQELQQQQAQRDQLVNALRDQDWIERLTSNEDFKRYLARVQEAQTKNLEHQAELVNELTQPRKTRDERNALNERLLIVAATIEATATVTGWPRQQEKNLEAGRKLLPDIEKKIKGLGGE